VSSGYPPYARLPLAFEPAGLLRDWSILRDEPWEVHFNRQYHSGGWRGLPLREPATGSRGACPGEYPAECYRDLPRLARAPALAAVLAALPCPLKSARLLALDAGGWIREHRDPGVSLGGGEARLHVPILTHEQVYFYVSGTRVPPRAGELWYIDIDRPHRVVNLGTGPRVHLVVDCVANDWLFDHIRQGDTGDPWPNADDPQRAFEDFRNQVFQDEDLQARLLAEPDPTAFPAHAVALGAERGCVFTPAEVQAAINQGRRAWIEQFLFR
jgi:hypothetical protein